MIALVQPRLPDRNYIPNLGLLSLAGVLEREGYPIRIFDENLDPNYLSELVRLRPRLVGFTAVTAAVNRVGRAAELLKESVDGVLIAAGGPHVSVLPEETLSGGRFDYCVVGEGEYPLLELVRSIFDGQGTPEDIPNLVYRSNGRIRSNPGRPFLGPEELDRLPFAPFHLLDLERVFPRITHASTPEARESSP
ncbi:MAG: cobalamin-dependent protein [Candidatus Erginobacter occultus]|nr:cobalamin-dependent protein [Candidatus Erginobacter occultus]